MSVSLAKSVAATVVNRSVLAPTTTRPTEGHVAVITWDWMLHDLRSNDLAGLHGFMVRQSQ